MHIYVEEEERSLFLLSPLAFSIYPSRRDAERVPERRPAAFYSHWVSLFVHCLFPLVATRHYVEGAERWKERKKKSLFGISQSLGSNV